MSIYISTSADSDKDWWVDSSTFCWFAGLAFADPEIDAELRDAIETGISIAGFDFDLFDPGIALRMVRLFRKVAAEIAERNGSLTGISAADAPWVAQRFAELRDSLDGWLATHA